MCSCRLANKRRLPEFKNRLGHLAHAKGDGSDWSIAEWTNAMAGEVGEACNVAKKIRRGDFDDNLQAAHNDLAEEIADVVIYAAIIFSQLGLNFGEVVRSKFNKKSDQVGSQVKL